MAKRINKAIELLEAGQLVFMTDVEELSYESGKSMAKSWADVILLDFEHYFFDIGGLTKFMKGLCDGGPTASGHPTPAVVATLPSNCTTVDEMLANAWQVRHLLSTGAHGILHTHVRNAEAMRVFVATCRYPFQEIGRGAIPEGLRGAGGQARPAPIWGLTPADYVHAADPWPLNPKGELLLGVKIEDRHCLQNADEIAAIPGLGFAEWGPGDMGMSFGEPDAHNPPYPEILNDARNKIKAALDTNGVAFYCGWNDDSMSGEEQIKYAITEVGSKLLHTQSKELAEYGRALTGRTMPV
jgi:4-hydroxy-2-oxoheptanedioate aldolase